MARAQGSGPRSEDATSNLRVSVLGEVSVQGLDRAALGSRKARQLLRHLALARGRPVSADSIAEILWRDEPPAEPVAQVAVLVSRLRRVIGSDNITHGDAGYALRYQWLDVEAAEALIGEAEGRLPQGRYAAALSAARGALALLERSPSLAADDPLAGRLTARARHLCARALLASGDHSGAVEAAQRALDADALDEEALRLAMTGMAAGSRSPAALALYEEVREHLVDELGASPSAATDLVHRAILRGEQVPGAIVGWPGRGPGSGQAAVATVGRERELAALDEAWLVARSRGMTRVSVEGEPGIGKTHVVRAWIGALTSDTPVLSARCDEVNPSLPLQPILDALHGRLRELGYERSEDLLGAENRLLAPLFGTSLRMAEPDFDVALSLAASPAGAAILSTALIAVVRRMCAAPAVLFIDDVHRIDTSSATWLGQLAQRAPETRLLVIATRRTMERLTFATDRRITVGPLSVDAAAVIVGADRAVNLHSRTGGNPLFLTELANAAPDVAVPETVQASIMARCASCPDAADTLRAAAVLGMSVDVELLAQVLRADPIRIIDHLEQGTRLALLEERQATFVFRHEIAREAMAASAGALRRSWLHREAALSLEASPDADPMMLAEHARLSGERHIAARALTRASHVAITRFDHATARALIEDALDFEQTTEALLQRARLSLWQGRYAEADADSETALARADDPRALEVAGAIAYYRRNFSRSRALAEVLLDRTTEPRLQLGGLVIGARASHAVGDLATALALIERATDVARGSGLQGPSAVHAFVLTHRGAVEMALRLTEEAAAGAITEPLSTAYTSMHDDFIGGYTLATCGRVEEALERWQRGARDAQRQGFVRYTNLCSNLSSWVYRGIGDLSRARELNHAAREGGRDADYRELEVYAVLDLCETDLIEGDVLGATSGLRRANDLAKEDYAYRWRHRLRVGVLEARIALVMGEADRARLTARQVAQRSREHGAARYELLASLVELEAASTLTGSVDAEQLMQLCGDLPRLAGPDAWSLAGHAAAVTGVQACAELAHRHAARLAATLPDEVASSFVRYARTRLDMMSTSGFRG